MRRSDDLSPLEPLMRVKKGCTFRWDHKCGFFFVITHESRVCSQHSFGLPLRMNGMHKLQFDRARFDVLPCRVKLTQSTALEQKRLDLRSLSPAVPNLWLLLVLGNTCPYPYFLVGLCFDCSLLSEGLATKP